MMSIGPEETSPEVPDSDALEQRTPALPEDSQEWPVTGQLPDDVPQADFIEQHKSVQPDTAGYDRITAAGAEADEGDLIEGNLGPTGDDEDDYPDAREEIL
jgi:hypothetical protein